LEVEGQYSIPIKERRIISDVLTFGGRGAGFKKIGSCHLNFSMLPLKNVVEEIN
jgi:hypothetical protein